MKKTIRQSKKKSLLEAIVNTAIGFVVAYWATRFILAEVGVIVSYYDNLLITLFMTFISVVRNYFVRRFFLWIEK